MPERPFRARYRHPVPAQALRRRTLRPIGQVPLRHEGVVGALGEDARIIALGIAPRGEPQHAGHEDHALHAAVARERPDLHGLPYIGAPRAAEHHGVDARRVPREHGGGMEQDPRRRIELGGSEDELGVIARGAARIVGPQHIGVVIELLDRGVQLPGRRRLERRRRHRRATDAARGEDPGEGEGQQPPRAPRPIRRIAAPHASAHASTPHTPAPRACRRTRARNTRRESR